MISLIALVPFILACVAYVITKRQSRSTRMAVSIAAFVIAATALYAALSGVDDAPLPGARTVDPSELKAR